MSRSILAALALVAASVIGWQWLGTARPSPEATGVAAITAAAPEPLPMEDTAELSEPPPETDAVDPPRSVQEAMADLPEELVQAVSEWRQQHGSENSWATQPVLPNLERWRWEAEQTPERAAALANALRRCVPWSGRHGSVEEVEREWRRNQAWSGAGQPTPEQLEQRRQALAQEFAFHLVNLLDCEGLSAQAAAREYIRWLERAGRELPSSEHRDRVRLSFIEDPFPDLPNAADRIGSIDEVLRRRDTARAWLRELREAGVFRAIRLSAAAYSSRGELEPADAMETYAWQFVLDVRAAVDAQNRPGSASTATGSPAAVDLWGSGRSRFSANDEANEEAIRRGREHYLRIFGAPPG